MSTTICDICGATIDSDQELKHYRWHDGLLTIRGWVDGLLAAAATENTTDDEA